MFIVRRCGSVRLTDAIEDFSTVADPLDVEVIMEPPTPANATEMKNVTLVCNISSGNPQSFRKVNSTNYLR
jgi:hypothetical protein